MMEITNKQKLNFIDFAIRHIEPGVELSSLLRKWNDRDECPCISSIPELIDRGPWGNCKNSNSRITSLKKAKTEILCREESYTEHRRTILWLDDKRNPYLDWNKKVPQEKGEIYWVRTFNEFKAFIEKYGCPHIISFDHDLADEHYVPKELWNDYYLSKKYQEAIKYNEGTGEDCAIWLMNYLEENEIETPKFFVHSSNEVGRDKIKEVLGLKQVEELKSVQ